MSSHDISKKIFENINETLENSLIEILQDISQKYDININELESKELSIKKKKLNGYNKYNSKRRKELLEEKSDMTFGDISKIIGEEWRNLSEKEKGQYK